MLEGLINRIKVILGGEKKKRGGRKKMTLPTLLNVTAIRCLRKNERMCEEMAFKKYGMHDIWAKYNDPVTRTKERCMWSAKV